MSRSEPCDRFLPDAEWPAWQSALWDPAVIHVVRVWLPDRMGRYDADFSLLSRDEQARATRFLLETVRQRFVACRAVLRRILAERLILSPAEIEFDYGEHGKPGLVTDNHPLSFNVSHSDDAALIALSWNCDVGVDLEFDDDRDWRPLARRFFAAAEWEQLESLPPALQRTGFYRVWTCKEAYLKATGQGMALPLGRFAVCADPRFPSRLIEVRDNPT